MIRSDDKNSRFDKASAALRIFYKCFGHQGIWADPTRYRNTCWTRDFVMAVLPLLLQRREIDVAKRHLVTLSELQQPNGQIPILFLDNENDWVKMKEAEEIANGKEPFMLGRYRAGQLWNLTPGTRDSEIMYIIGMYEYAQATNDTEFLDINKERIARALGYIEFNLMQDGLVLGADWRDTMHEELKDKPLLTNNCLLYRAYSLMGETQKAEDLRQRINEVHFRNGSCIDYPGSERFDPLGASFAVLYGVVKPTSYGRLAELFHSVDTPYGLTIKCRHNPHTLEEVGIIDRTDGVLVWPFVVGFAILALQKMGYDKFAQEQFAKLLKMDGFREWYDPETGKGYGAQEQLWSAVLFMRVFRITG